MNTNAATIFARRQFFGVEIKIGAVIAVIAIIMVLAIAMSTPGFFSLFNLKSVLRAAAFVGILAVGLTFVTISGNFFLLSLAEIAAFVSVFLAFCLIGGFPPALAVLTALAVAVFLGMAQGWMIGLGGNPIVVTIGFAGMIFGLASLWSNNAVIPLPRPSPVEGLGTGLFLGVPNVTWAFLLTGLVGELVLRFTVFGRAVYLAGDNSDSARAVGLNQMSIAISVCGIAALTAAFVGILFTAQISQGYVNHFSGTMGASGSLTINAIAAVLVGGSSIMGGSGSVLRSVLGAIAIAVVDNLMVLRGFESGARILAVGSIIVVCITILEVSNKGYKK